MTTTILRAAGAAALAASALSAVALSTGSTPAAAPPTPLHDVVDTYHGTQVHDPYRWLEDADAPAVKQWIDSQNTYTGAVMSAFKDSAAIIKRVGALALTSTQRSDPQIVGGLLFYLRQTPPQAEAVLIAEGWRVGNNGAMMAFFAQELELGPTLAAQ
jgi:prolyl oligopeptidase